MTKQEFLPIITRLFSAFEKTRTSELLDVWFDELGSLTMQELNQGIRHFLDIDQRSFPRIGEFKAAIRGKNRKFPQHNLGSLSSCPKCNHGVCSFIEIRGGIPYTFASRCSCPSGDAWPYPLHDPDLRTVKELRAKEKAKLLAPDERHYVQQQLEILQTNTDIPF